MSSHSRVSRNSRRSGSCTVSNLLVTSGQTVLDYGLLIYIGEGVLGNEALIQQTCPAATSGNAGPRCLALAQHGLVVTIWSEITT
jgi:hypothetical protein